MSHVAVEISGDGGDGGVRITGGEGARYPRAGIRVYGDPSDPTPVEIVELVHEDFESDENKVDITGGGVYISPSDAHSGEQTLYLGLLGNNSTDDAVVTVPAGATLMTVWYQVSSEPNYDKFRVLLDGVQAFEDSGETPWTELSFNVTGVSVVTFRYQTDSSNSVGDDWVLIDDLRFFGPSSNRPEVVNGRAYGRVKAEMGELSDGDYGIAVVNDAGALTKLTDFVFGPQAAYDQGEGTRTFATHAATYGDLVGASVGPSVDVMIGETGRCLIIVGAEITWDDGTTGDFRYSDTYGGRMSVALSGANIRAASDAWSYYFSQAWAFEFNTAVRLEQRGAANGSRMHFLTGLNPGLTTFTAKYRCVYNNQIQPARFKDRTLIVFPY